MTGAVARYDLSTPEPPPREVGKRLLAQRETIAEQMRIALRKLLRLKTEVTVGEPVVERVRHFAAFADGRAWWVSGGAKDDPAGRSVLLGCASGLVYAAVDRTLGGPGIVGQPGKTPTAIEFEFGMRFLRDVFAALAGTLRVAPLSIDVAPHQPLCEPLLTYMPDREEPFARISWKVKILDQEHELLLCIARRLLEAAEPKQEAATAAAGVLAGPVASAPIELLVELARCRLKIDEAAHLARGDIVLFDLPPGEPLDVKVQGKARFRARLGTHDGRYAIEVTDVVGEEQAPAAAAAKPAAAVPAANGANGANAAKPAVNANAPANANANANAATAAARRSVPPVAARPSATDKKPAGRA
jgi:flagellar motor switch protein FliM